MARGIPTYDGNCSSCDGGGAAGGGGSTGRQYIRQSSFPPASSSYLRSDSFYYSSSDRDTIGDVFFGSDDIRDTRGLTYKEDVLESYQRETDRKSLRRQSKEGSLFSISGCFEFLKLFICSCCRCIF